MYDEVFWNKRYASDDYLYGTEPNAFLAEHYRLLRGPVLSLSEGEGRNAVLLASHGLEVVGVDISAVALAKARKLAKSRGSENQLSRHTGGPRDLDMPMTVDKLRREFPNCEPVVLRELERDVSEGEGHAGMASVVQFIARKLA